MSKKWRPKQLDTADEGSREFLIWSMYHRCWHRRSEVGGASGYTNDILEAGIFETSKARSYHDAVRDRAIHITKAKPKIVKAVALENQNIGRLISKVDTVQEFLRA